VPSRTREIREASTASLVGVMLIMVASALGFTLLTAPFEKLLGSGGGALPAAIHGLVAFLYLFVGTIGLYLGLGRWAILHLALRKSDREIPRGLIVFLVGVAIATTLIWHRSLSPWPATTSRRAEILVIDREALQSAGDRGGPSRGQCPHDRTEVV